MQSGSARIETGNVAHLLPGSATGFPVCVANYFKVTYSSLIWITALHVDSLVVYHIVVHIVCVASIAAMVTVGYRAVQDILL